LLDARILRKMPLHFQTAHRRRQEEEGVHISVTRVAIISLVMALAACQTASPAPRPTVEPNLPATTRATQLSAPAACENRFVEHTLPFITGGRIREIATYISNGAGLAVNDLDGDGNFDLVFASIDGPAKILWNEGRFSFVPADLDAPFTRAAATVDVDADGRLDVVLTQREGSVLFFRNLGERRFERAELPGVVNPAYSMAWADLNNDSRLDLVTAAYDIELKQKQLPQAEQAGVYVYLNTGSGFKPSRLSDRAEALAIGLLDLNNDGRRDVWVGNDFQLQDGIWLQGTDGAWQPARPFATTSHSTMSIDWGDLDNDGRIALFTTDMNPSDTSPAVLAEWLPMIQATQEQREPDDRQITQNVLLQRGGDNVWRNEAPQRGIDATGWSWAGRFGDLDRDGYLDLYVVNGMIASNLFKHLPNGELVERNRAFHNAQRGRFQPAQSWGLDSQGSGRGMQMADLDGDGDLDIVINNLRAPAQVFENKLCGGENVLVDLRWPASGNTRAIGATLLLHTSAGVFQREVRATSGYISGEPARVHFGIPKGATILFMDVIWPDGKASRVEKINSQTLIEVTR
jgi:hypothetical protein